MEKRKLRTAYHEAGHACIARHFHICIIRASIIPARVTQGRVFVARSRFHGEKAAVILLAGPLAEKRFDARCRPDSDGTEEIGAWSALSYICSNVKETDARLELAKMQAQRLVLQLWPQISTLAEALLQRKRLSGRQVREVITRES